LNRTPLRRALIALSLVALVAGPAAEARRGHYFGGRPGPGTANPSELVATEIAFNRRAKEKGQWAAFREYADQDAVMFVPQAVRAKTWLSNQKEPATSLSWEPYDVWMSCDGSLGVTKGAWTRSDGTVGYYTTIWKRQGKRSKDAEYRWVLDQGDTLAKPLDQPDFLRASVSDCPKRGDPRPADRPDAPPPTFGPQGSGSSDDGTLSWHYAVEPDGARTVTISFLKDGKVEDTIYRVAAPNSAAPKAN